MKRSSTITWDQLKVGALIAVSIAVLGVAALRLGRAANLFSRRYELIALVPEANGLRRGGAVLVAGQLAGTIKNITFLPIDNDTMHNLRVEMAIDHRLSEQVRGDSKARIRTVGLLGDKVIDISPGTPKFPAHRAGDTIRLAQTLDYEQVLAKAAGAVDDVVGLTHDLNRLTSSLIAGKGTMGQLITNPALYNELEGTLSRTNALLGRVQSSHGAFARFLDDPALYDETVRAVSSVDSLVVAMRSRNGSMGRLLTDTALYENAVGVIREMQGVVGNADSLVKSIRNKDGSVGRLINEPAMYEALLKLIQDFSAMIADIRKDPSRYTKGIVRVF